MNVPDIADDVCQSLVGDEIERALAMLSERERDIIKRRFGLGQPPMTLAQVGECWHISRPRVAQIQETALSKLRRHKKNQLIDFL